MIRTSMRQLLPERPGTFRRRGPSHSRLATCGLLAALCLAPQLAGQEAAQYFRQNCASCHTIGGGRLTGPDLKGVEQRKDRQWLVRFIQDPKRVMDSGDPYALQLKTEARDVIMPTVPGMTRDRAESLLDLIAAESQLEKSQFAGLAISMEPFTPVDVAQGRSLLLGTQRLSAGGPACISCHAVRGAGLLGGGRLGPDLTRVYERLGGDAPRKNLSAWLMAPATATMQPVFKSHPLQPEEIHALVAYFESTAAAGGEADMSGPLSFLLMGAGLAIGGLFGMDAIWRRRFRGVRRAIVAESVARS